MKIEDIAKLAHVSKSTVSLALNGKPGVNEKTRKLVLSIAQEHHYVPLRKTRKTKNQPVRNVRFVGCINDVVVTSDYRSLPFFSELIGYLVEENSAYGYNLSFSTINQNSITHDLKPLEQEQPSDAIVLLGTNLTEAQIFEVSRIQPVLTVLDTCLPEMDLSFVSINNYQGAVLAAQHILINGHTKIGYAMANVRIKNVDQRKRGFFNVLKRNGLSVDKRFILQFPGMVIQSAPEEPLDFLKDADNRPTVFFCENDYIAISLIKALTKVGLNVPNDVSVVGFDDIHEACAITPELTTIQVPKKELAQRALETIATMFAQTYEFNQQVFINTRLIERRSFLPIKSES